MQKLTLILVTLLALLVPPTMPDDNRVDEARRLVQQLGSSSFAARRKATDRLAELGADAIAPLAEGARSRNRELRYRSQRLLASLHVLEFERQLQAFAKTGKAGDSLPGWDKFRTLYGSEGDARQLFASMQRAEPDLMRAMEGPLARIALLINRRVEGFQQSRRFQGSDVRLGTIAAILFAGADQEVKLPETSIKLIYGLCGYAAFGNEMGRRSSSGQYFITHDARSDVLRGLFARWMQRTDGWVAYQGFRLALNYDIRAASATALQAIQAKGASPYVRQYALQLLSRFGEKKDIPVITTLLQDQTFCGGIQRVNNKQFRTQIRDIALACLLSIEKLDHRKFGFPRADVTNGVVNLSSIGFADDASRQKAYDLWVAHTKKQSAP